MFLRNAQRNRKFFASFLGCEIALQTYLAAEAPGIAAGTEEATCEESKVGEKAQSMGRQTQGPQLSSFSWSSLYQPVVKAQGQEFSRCFQAPASTGGQTGHELQGD